MRKKVLTHIAKLYNFSVLTIFQENFDDVTYPQAQESTSS